MLRHFWDGSGPGHGSRHRGHRKQAHVGCGSSTARVSCLSADKLPYACALQFSPCTTGSNDSRVKGLSEEL